jgi:hypothetical protein
MFRTSYVHLQEDYRYIVHAALHGMLFIQYILQPEDKHKMFETSRRQEELN